MSNSINDYIKKGIAIKKSEGYYYIGDGASTFLGSHHVVALNKIKKLLVTKPSDVSTSGQAKNFDEKNIGNFDSSEPKSTQIQDIEDIYDDEDEFASEISHLRQSSSGDDLTIFIGGLKDSLRDSDHVSHNHPVKRIPYKLSWGKISKMGRDGTTRIIDGHDVLKRSLFDRLVEKYDLRVNRDDNPDADYIQAGDNVLCICRYDEWAQKKKRNSLEGSLAPMKNLASRNEETRQLARMTEQPGGIDRVRSRYESDRKSAISEKAQQQHASELMARPLDEIMTQLSNTDNLTIEQMSDLQMQANDQLSIGKIPVNFG